MTALELLRIDCDLAFAEVTQSIEGVEENLAWSVLPAVGEEYLHSDGSIYGLVLHVATCKMMLASVAFRQTEIRWRELADRIDAFESHWEAAVDLLKESQAYWLSSWATFTESHLDRSVPRGNGQEWPAWRILRLNNYHDNYHAGQITVVRYAVEPTSKKPPSAAEDIRKYCRELPAW